MFAISIYIRILDPLFRTLTPASVGSLGKSPKETVNAGELHPYRGATAAKPYLTKPNETSANRRNIRRKASCGGAQ